MRVITLQTGGVPDGIPDEKTRAAIGKSIARGTMLGRAATLADVGNAAVFAASDLSRALTATRLNITCGAVPDLAGMRPGRPRRSRTQPQPAYVRRRRSYASSSASSAAGSAPAASARWTISAWLSGVSPPTGASRSRFVGNG